MESSRWSSSYHKKSTNTNGVGGGGDHLLLQLPESPREPMEFLSRSWSASAIKVCKAVAPHPPPATTPASLLLPKSSFGNGNYTASGGGIAAIPEKNGNEKEEEEEEEAKAKISGNTFSFASSATSQLVLERIMAQSEVSPLTSGRLSHSSGPLNASCLAEDTDSPLNLSPNDEFEDVVKYLRVNNSLQPLFTTKWNGYTASGANTPGTKTVGRWLKERREKKKEETRTQDAQVHAAVTVAGLASAVAAIASATAAASSSTGKDKQMAKTDVAVASAATLVAAQCVEAAEAMGAEREHLVSAISSAVNVHSHGDISTLTAAAATALRGVATLKARALKEVWNIATMIPADKGLGGVATGHTGGNECGPRGYVNSPALDDNFLGICNQELLGRGRELLKRTRNGDLHWKIVSVYIHRTGQVMLKMKSKHVGSTITKKKKNVVLKVCKDLPAWPGRHLFEDGEKRRYFGLQTDGRGLVEFECKNQKEYEIWTQGVSRLLSIVAERRQNNYKSNELM